MGLPAELSGVVHVGSCLDVALVRVVDGGGPGIGPAQDEDETIQTHRRGVLVIYTNRGRGRDTNGGREGEIIKWRRVGIKRNNGSVLFTALQAL